MRETKFIEQNKKDWERFEAILKSPSKEPDQLSDQFLRIINDLSYARTFYPNRSVRVYLNSLAQKVFYSIYKNKKEKRRRYLTFWTREIPSVAFRKRKDLLLSFVIFALAVAIGVISAINDPEFARVILGDNYVNMTIENIESNDPMAVYKSMNGVDMFLGITINNLRVAFQTFVMGIFMALGTVAIMVYNGIMVGTFQYFFIERGLFWESALTIWLHGTLEISAIIIAGASGLVLGKGLLFPGTYPRAQALQISAGQGLKLFIGIVPILIVAAIIESFMTRFTDAPDMLKAGLILLSFIFIVFYFFLYPQWLHRKGLLAPEIKPELTPHTPLTIVVKDKIKNIGQIFRDMFAYYRQHITKILLNGVLLALMFGVLPMVLVYLTADPESMTYYLLDEPLPLFDLATQPWMFVSNVLFLSVIIHFSTKMLVASFSGSKVTLPTLYRSFMSLQFSLALTVSAIINATLFLPTAVTVIFLLLIPPVLILGYFMSYYERTNLVESLMASKDLLGAAAGRVYLLYICLLLLVGSFVLFLNSPISGFYQEIVQWNFSIEGSQRQIIMLSLDAFKLVFGLSIALPVIIAGMSLLYFGLKEILEANGLNSRISQFGMSK